MDFTCLKATYTATFFPVFPFYTPWKDQKTGNTGKKRFKQYVPRVSGNQFIETGRIKD